MVVRATPSSSAVDSHAGVTNLTTKTCAFQQLKVGARQPPSITGLIDLGLKARCLPSLRQASTLALTSDSRAHSPSSVHAAADSPAEGVNESFRQGNGSPALLRKKLPGSFAEEVFERATWSSTWKDLIGDVKRDPSLKDRTQILLSEWFEYFEQCEATGVRVGQQLDDLKHLKPLVKTDPHKAGQLIRNIDGLRRHVDTQIDTLNAIRLTATEVTDRIFAGVAQGKKGGKILRLISEAEASDIQQNKVFKQLRKQGAGGSFEEHKWFFTDPTSPPVQGKKLPRLLEIDVPADTFELISQYASNLPNATHAALRIKDGSGVEQLEKGAFGVHREGLRAWSQLLNSPQIKWRIK